MHCRGARDAHRFPLVTTFVRLQRAHAIAKTAVTFTLVCRHFFHSLHDHDTFWRNAMAAAGIPSPERLWWGATHQQVACLARRDVFRSLQPRCLVTACTC